MLLFKAKNKELKEWVLEWWCCRRERRGCVRMHWEHGRGPQKKDIWRFIYLYLLYESIFQPMPGRHTSMPRKENWEKSRKGKGSRHIVKHPTPSQATDALTGDEEQNGKQKRAKRNRERVPNPATLLPSVASYNAQGSYGKPILFKFVKRKKNN